jgi:hypothetical protein
MVDFAIEYEGGTYSTALILEETPKVDETLKIEIEGSSRLVKVDGVFDPVFFEGSIRTPIHCHTIDGKV